MLQSFLFVFPDGLKLNYGSFAFSYDHDSGGVFRAPLNDFINEGRIIRDKVSHRQLIDKMMEFSLTSNRERSNFEIVLDARPESLERNIALQASALSPKVFKEIWDIYTTVDVDNHTLVYDLTLGRKSAGKAPFSESAALDVAQLYRDSLNYSGLVQADANFAQTESDQRLERSADQQHFHQAHSERGS